MTPDPHDDGCGSGAPSVPGAVHDFNNMLGVILGRAELARKRVAPSDELHAHLVEIHDAAQRSAELTRQLLAYASRQSVTAHVIDPNEAIETSMRMLRLIVGEGVTLRWRGREDIWLVKIDPGRALTRVAK